MNQTENIPNSPNELILKNQIENHEFSPEEILNLFNKLSYQKRDNLIFEMMKSQRYFYYSLIMKMRENPELIEENQLKFMNLIHDYSIMKSIIESHSLI